jgi:hypothetical protein
MILMQLCLIIKAKWLDAAAQTTDTSSRPFPHFGALKANGCDEALIESGAGTALPARTTVPD